MTRMIRLIVIPLVLIYNLSEAQVSLPLASRSISMNIGGVDVVIPLASTANLKTREELTDVNVQMEADFNNLQKNITTILSNVLGESQECGNRLKVTNARFTSKNPDAQLKIAVQFEKWKCGDDYKANLLRQSAVLDVLLTPGVTNDTLFLVPSLQEIAVAEKGTATMDKVAERIIIDFIQNKVGSRLASELPKGVSRFDPVFNEIYFHNTDRGIRLFLDIFMSVNEQELEILIKLLNKS